MLVNERAILGPARNKMGIVSDYGISVQKYGYHHV